MSITLQSWGLDRNCSARNRFQGSLCTAVSFLGRVGAFSLHSEFDTPRQCSPQTYIVWGKGKAAGPSADGFAV
jgi:hypothetical protein